MKRILFLVISIALSILYGWSQTIIIKPSSMNVWKNGASTSFSIAEVDSVTYAFDTIIINDVEPGLALPYTNASLGTDFVNQSVLGVQWNQGSSYTQASGWTNSTFTATPSEAWLVSPALNFENQDTIVLSFDYTIRYGSSITESELAEYHKVYISNDYEDDVTTATWVELDYTPVKSPYSNWTLYPSGDIRIPVSFLGEKRVHIAFVYKCGNTQAKISAWELKNFSVKGITANINPTPDPEPDPDPEPNPNPTPDANNLNANVVGSGDRSVKAIEIPKRNTQYDYIPHYITDSVLNYAIEYIPTKLHPNWVAYRYDANLAARNVSRSNAWAAEPYYNNNKQYQMAVGYYNGYQRGHLIGSAERLSTTEANEQTFYMSNMSPMLKLFNETYWGDVETLVRNWGRACTAGDTLYVVKGGTLDDRVLAPITMSNTLGQSVEVPVPQYFYIAVLYRSKQGAYRAIGFWLEHKDYGDESSTALQAMRRAAVCSIDALEELTGLDFFCNLPDDVEETVEKQYNQSAWSGL